MTRAITVNVVGNATQLGGALDDADKKTTSFAQKAGKVAKAASLAVGAGLAKMFKDGVDGINEGAEAEAKFTQVTGKLTGAAKLNTAAFEDYASAIQNKTRFTYEDTLATGGFIAAQDGLQSVVANGVGGYEDLTQVALDLATAQGTDGPAAAAKLAKALAAPEKAAGALRKMGISLTAAEQDKVKAWVKSGDTAKAQGLILDKLKAKTQGAAEAAGNTMAGQMDRAKNAFGEVEESLASQLIPALTKLMGVALRVSTWAQDNPGKMKLVVGVVGGLAAAVWLVNAAIKAWTFATKIQAASQWLLNAAMTANPIGLVVAAVAALAVALVLLWKKSETFRDVVTAVWSAIKNSAITAIQFVVDKYLWMIETVLNGAAKAFGWVPGIGGKLKAAARHFADFRDEVNSSLEGIKDKDVVVRVKFAGNVGAAIDAQHAEQQLRLPGRANGGKVLRGRRYVVGERGPEEFVPGMSGSIVPNSSMGGGGGGTVRVVVDVTGQAGKLKEMIREMVRIDGGGNVQAAFGR